MPAVGPQLTHHLVDKRKREEQDGEAYSVSATGEAKAKKHARIMRPSLPPHLQAQQSGSESDNDSSIEPGSPKQAQGSKQSFVEKATRSVSEAAPKDDSSSEEDEYGPRVADRLEIGQESAGRHDRWEEAKASIANANVPRRQERDEWMSMPTEKDGLAARMDPTKTRAKKFNTGKGASATNQTDADKGIWNETPEEKRKRLENEVLGISTSTKSAMPGDLPDARKRAQDEEKARTIREYNNRHRNKSLVELHKGAAKKKEEDDATKRGFNWEKDMASSSKVSHSQKKQLLGNSAGFSSKFSSGNYL